MFFLHFKVWEINIFANKSAFDARNCNFFSLGIGWFRVCGWSYSHISLCLITNFLIWGTALIPFMPCESLGGINQGELSLVTKPLSFTVLIVFIKFLFNNFIRTNKNFMFPVGVMRLQKVTK